MYPNLLFMSDSVLTQIDWLDAMEYLDRSSLLQIDNGPV